MPQGRIGRWLTAAGHRLGGNTELIGVIVAAAVAVAFPAPLRWLDRRHAIDIVLAVLVFTAALGVPAGSVDALRAKAVRIAVVLASSAVLLPILGWAASRAVSAADLRHGVLALGLAPAEVASVATVSMAGGDTAATAGVLVGSTVITVVCAGPILGLLAGGAVTHPVGVLINLTLVIALPLVIGLAARAPLRRRPRWAGAAARGGATAAAVTVTVLVGLVASQVSISRAYLGVLAGAAIFLAGSVALGMALGRGAPPPLSTAVLMTTSMRDFAVAAAIAASAFGPAAAAPLGIYGVVVIVWGMALASAKRRRAGGRSPGVVVPDSSQNRTSGSGSVARVKPFREEVKRWS